MRYLLDTNVLSELIRHPSSAVSERIAKIEYENRLTSVIAAAEIRYGVAKVGSRRLADQVEAVLGALDVAAFESPADIICGRLRAELEGAGRLIGPNDLLIAAHALALSCTLLTDNVREFSRVPGLAVENWLR
jgi:tRNA(fMet)-specific endonuclease VapC